MFENPFDSKLYLVIDDFGDMRSMLKSMLRTLGANRIEATRNAKEALSLMAHARFDVVLCDYNLGAGKNGQQLLEEARHRRLINIATTFIMVTAENTREMVMGAVEYEPDSYLSKPFTKELLGTRLSKLFQRKADLLPVNDALERKNFARAIQLLDQRIAAKPKNLGDLVRLKADFCYQSGQYDQALDIYQQLLANRDIPWARLGLGKVQFARKQYVEANETFQRLCTQCKTLMPAYDWLARTQRAMGLADDAQKTLQNAIALSPKSIKRQQTLGELAMQSKNFDLAEQAFGNAVELGEFSIYRHPAMYAGLARAKSATGKHDDAMHVVERLNKDFEDDTADFYAASAEAAICQDQGNHEAAEECLQRAQTRYRQLGQHAPATVGLELARSFAHLGRNDEAAQILRNTIQNNHDDVDLLVQVTDVYRDVGSSDSPEAWVHSIRQEVIDMNNQGVKLIASGKFHEAIALFAKAAEGMANNLVINLNAARALIMLMEKQGTNSDSLGLTRKYVERARLIAPDDTRLAVVLRRFEKLNPSGG